MSTEERQESATPPPLLQETLAENPLEADDAPQDNDSAYAVS
ncbi:hypothetical protein FNYG_15959 [Fusarium nygamai]|uniref:Uncharacterized protein n=1 Tax=Gibberella nygamai TaxID=42673 RepID=A0A2K0TY07_GIBNY|nr:hypothetical protein FNYG_15959 [Fusarium nygamai]